MPNEAAELRVIGSDGTGERTLYSKSPYSDGGWIIPDAWSSDGKHILARVHLPGEGGRPPGRGNYAIVLVSVSDGSLRTLKELKSSRRYRRRTFLSRDSSYVAYDFPPDQEVAAGDVFILPAAGGEAAAVAPHSLVCQQPVGEFRNLGRCRQRRRAAGRTRVGAASCR